MLRLTASLLVAVDITYTLLGAGDEDEEGSEDDSEDDDDDDDDDGIQQLGRGRRVVIEEINVSRARGTVLLWGRGGPRTRGRVRKAFFATWM